MDPNQGNPVAAQLQMLAVQKFKEAFMSAFLQAMNVQFQEFQDALAQQQRQSAETTVTPPAPKKAKKTASVSRKQRRSANAPPLLRPQAVVEPSVSPAPSLLSIHDSGDDEVGSLVIDESGYESTGEAAKQQNRGVTCEILSTSPYEEASKKLQDLLAQKVKRDEEQRPEEDVATASTQSTPTSSRPESSATATPYDTQAALEAKPDADGKYECPICHKKFSRRWYVYGGHLRVHLGLKPFQCGKCGKDFNDKSNCRVHERVCGKKRGDRAPKLEPVNLDEFSDVAPSSMDFEVSPSGVRPPKLEIAAPVNAAPSPPMVPQQEASTSSARPPKLEPAVVELASSPTMTASPEPSSSNSSASTSNSVDARRTFGPTNFQTDAPNAPSFLHGQTSPITIGSLANIKSLPLGEYLKRALQDYHRDTQSPAKSV